MEDALGAWSRGPWVVLPPRPLPPLIPTLLREVNVFFSQISISSCWLAPSFWFVWENHPNTKKMTCQFALQK